MCVAARRKMQQDTPQINVPVARRADTHESTEVRLAIVTCADAAMLPAALCALWSVSRRMLKSPAEYYLVTSGLESSEIAAAADFFSAAGAKVRMLNCDTHRLEDRQMGRFSQATLMRLSLATILPEDLDRVLYIDADVLAQGDVGPLLAMPLGGKAFGAVEDIAATGNPAGKADRLPLHRRRIGLPEGAPYFNAGCLLLDWQAVTASDLLERARRLVFDRPDLPFFDQDALNLVGQGDWLPLDQRWNRVVNRRGRVTSSILVHFAGARKPWKAGAGSLRRAYAPVYRRVLAHTIWRNFCDPLDFHERFATLPPRLALRLSGFA